MTCRFMDSTGNGWVSDAIRCFEYCLSKDAHVMSNSWGGVDYSKSLQVRPAQMLAAQHQCGDCFSSGTRARPLSGALRAADCH